MGQQQLLLLVLATVIVGLATVAGIQAFDENRRQAASDALQQEAATLASKVKGVYEKPAQFGGIDTTSSMTAGDMDKRLGIQDSTEVPSADGQCFSSTVNSGSSTQFQTSIKCEGTGEYSELVFYGIFDPSNEPTVRVQTGDI